MNQTVRAQRTRHILFERTAPDHSVDPSVLAGLAVEGLFTLAEPLFRPLTVEVGLVCVDAPTGFSLDEPDSAHRQLKASGSHPALDLDPMYNDTLVDEAARLDREAVLMWLTKQLSFPCQEPDSMPGWGELVLHAMDARLPEGLPITDDTIHVGYNGATLPYPVTTDAEGNWAPGPLLRNSDATPFDVRADCDLGRLRLDLLVGWSIWADEEGAGYGQIQTAVRLLLADGWKLTSRDRARPAGR